ncbi:MAG: hypothetical protein GQ564_07430 [Bacteroidales bacterium]|nr:hypothetical protein [Bacteroidales bacterium]
MKLKYTFIIAIISFCLFSSFNLFAQKKKYCFVYFDETTIEKTDSSYSKSVISNVVKVKERDNWKVKSEFYSEFKLKHSSIRLDTNNIQIEWAESKAKAKKKRKNRISNLNKRSSKEILLFSFEFKYEFSFEIGFD